jgi:protein-tyrosine phosphatase
VAKVVRSFFATLAVALATILVAPTPSLATGTVVNGVPIVGKTYSTWKAAGGTATFGLPLAARVSAKIGSANGYLQRFEKGQVFYSSLGKQTFVYPSTIKLSKVSNERDALARYGFASGVLLRTAKLTKATRLDKLKLATELKGGVIIDLRTPAVIAKSRDPKLPGVAHKNYAISSDAVYSRYVTDGARRTAFAKTLRAAAAAKGSVLIHCTAGKDRTGWAVAMLMYAIGADDSQVMAEYLRTSGTTRATLQRGLDQAITSYGSIDNYLRSGLGLTDADFAALKAKFA